MKNILLCVAIAACLFSCKSVEYLPVVTTKIEYRDRFVKDSIFQYDSVYIKDRGDTLMRVHHTYLYRTERIKDSIFIHDTIRVPYPVEMIKHIKSPLTGWQIFQRWCGRIAMCIVLIVGAYFLGKL